ncbi:MAG: MFS transporter, partial [Rhodanobacteraceae bacterium]
MKKPTRRNEHARERGENKSAAARHPAATIAATILGSSLAFVDGSVVNVALPTMGHAFGAGPAALAWMINAYLLPLGALILLGGAIGDHYGRRRVFQIGIAIFLLASVLCACAPTLALLLAGRGLQGIGSALLMPSSLAILGASFSGDARGRAIGTWAAAGAIAGAVGPLLGGWIVDAFGWRLIFLINLPIGLGAAVLACYADESRDRRKANRLDWTGGIVATVGLGLIVWALSAAAEPSTMRAALWTAGAAGTGLLIAFVRIESRKGSAALMPSALFATSSFIGLSLLTFFLYAALGGLIVLLPFLLIRLGHYSAIEAGAAMLPIPLLIGLGSRAMGGVAARMGGRLLLSGGALIVAAGMALYVRIGAGAIEYWRDLLPPTLVIAVGMAISVAPLTTSVMASVDTDHVGAASGFNSALARIGGLLATALLGFVFAAAADDAAWLARVHYAALAGAGCCFLASVCAYGLIS